MPFGHLIVLRNILFISSTNCFYGVGLYFFVQFYQCFILDINPLSNVLWTSNCDQSLGYLFILVIISFEVEKCLNLL